MSTVQFSSAKLKLAKARLSRLIGVAFLFAPRKLVLAPRSESGVAFREAMRPIHVLLTLLLISHKVSLKCDPEFCGHAKAEKGRGYSVAWL